MGLKSIELVGRALRMAGEKMLKYGGIEGTWIDVGAHRGDITLSQARHNPGLRVFAIEPNLRAAVKLMGRAPNYLVIPLAVAEEDGFADFYINAFEAASSLLSLNEEGVRSWEAAKVLKVDSVVSVPTMRLDTFMNITEIDTVDFLKVDAQGMDLAVIKSAGSRLRDIAKVVLEVWLTPTPIYLGVPSKNEVVAYLNGHGFKLVNTEVQSEGHEANLTFVQAQ